MYIDHEHFSLTAGPQPVPQPAISSLIEQGSGAHNEDVLLLHPNLYGVFDGATSLDGRQFNDGRTGGRIAAEIAAESFSRGKGSLPERAETANRHIRETMQGQGIGHHERHRFWSTSLAVVAVEGDRLHFCQTGDAHILLIDGNGESRLLSREIDIDAETLTLWQAANPPAGTTIHALLARQIQKVRLQMNRSYGVLNGEPEALDFLHHGTTSLDGVQHILLFTDGLQLPQPIPGSPQDWQAMTRLYLEGGLTELHRQVRRIQSGDPECRIYPRFKCHDDIAAVALTFTPAAQPAIALA